ncbi:hypothetical protein Ancab_023846 [Ancistrocladus abbreviatus]
MVIDIGSVPASFAVCVLSSLEQSTLQLKHCQCVGKKAQDPTCRRCWLQGVETALGMVIVDEIFGGPSFGIGQRHLHAVKLALGVAKVNGWMRFALGVDAKDVIEAIVEWAQATSTAPVLVSNSKSVAQEEYCSEGHFKRSLAYMDLAPFLV